jgi:flagellar hook assembly protein FlgD
VPLDSVEVGTFTSANPLATTSDFTASVDWKDGSPISLAAIAQAPDGTFHVFASHTFAEETVAGTPDTPVVTVKSTSGITATLNATATIADAPLLATPLVVSSVEGTSTTLTVGTFNDTDPNGIPGDYSVLINWGDGTTSTGSAVTITPSGASSLGATFTLSAAHTYGETGHFLITTTVTDVGGSTTSAVSSATVSAANLIGTPIPVTGTEGIPLVNTPVATFVDLGGAEPVGEYSATIDWGDGKPQSPGTITLGTDGTTFTVTGSHTYDEDGTYPVQVTILDTNVPVIITGNLDTGSDSGVSNSDKITNVAQPIFIGTSKPGSIINLYSNNNSTITLIGTGVTSVAGTWGIRTAFIPDGSYAIYATATDPNRPSEVTFPVAILGGTSGLPRLVIDTVGPVVTEAIFRPSIGKIMIAFQDSGGGLAIANVIDGSDFNFQVYGKTTFPPDLITSINVIRSGGPTDPIEEFLAINKGHKLPSGRYVLTVKSSGITDIAGNALDGEFYGYVPSGNGKPGGNFQALLVSNQSFVFAAMPTSSSATPNNPPGKTPKGYKTPTASHDSHEHEKKVVSVKQASTATTPQDLYDTALSLVTVKSAKKKHK